MKLKRVSALCSAFVLSVSSLLLIAFPGIAHAAAPYTCTWTDVSNSSTAQFSNAANWSGCNGAAPQPGDGDNLVFPSNATSPTNDLTNATFGSITFTGTFANEETEIGGNSFTLTGGITDNSTGGNTEFDFEGPVIISGNQSIAIAATDVIFFGGNLAGSGNLAVSSGTGGVLGLDGDENSYTGSLTMNSGLLNIYGQNSIAGSGAVNVNNGAAISFLSSACSSSTASTFTIGNLSLTGNGVSGTNGWAPDTKLSTSEVNCLAAPTYGEVYGTQPTDQTYTLNGTINLGSDVTFGSNGTSTTLTGTINGNYGIAASAGYPGQLIVDSQTNNSQTANGTYTAPTLTETLSSNQASTTVFEGGPVVITVTGSYGATTVASGATLKGNGTVAGADVETGGAIAPGDAPTCMTINGDFTESGTYSPELQSPGNTACTDYDQTIVTGSGNTINLTGGTLDVNLLNSFSPSVGQTFDVIKNQTGDPITGTFSGLASGAVFEVGSTKFAITYTGGTSGNDVVLTVVSSSTPVTGKTPGTPDTGFGLTSAHIGLPLAGSLMMAGGIYFISRKVKHPVATKRR